MTNTYSVPAAHFRKCKLCSKALKRRGNFLVFISNLCKVGNKLLFLFHDKFPLVEE